MSKAEATARAVELRTALLDHGVKAVSIELVQGRGGSGWNGGKFIACLGHHIVSHRGMGLTPGLRLVKEGRTGLPGPLCNGYGGFDEAARIICMGWANHPGEGGPLWTPKGTIPRFNGRPYLFGWEHEGGLRPADWTGSFRTFMGRCHAATVQWLGTDERSHFEHKDWATPEGRKIDRLGYTLASARAELVAAKTNQEAPVIFDFPLQRSALPQGKSIVAMLASLINYAENRTGSAVLPEDGTWPAALTQAFKSYGDANGEHVSGKEYAAIQIAVAKRAAQTGTGGGGFPYGTTVTLAKP